MDRFLRSVNIFLILFSAAFLMTHTIHENEFYKGSDEGYYFYYAKHISEKGLPGITDLLNWQASTPSARLHPAPSRVGHLLLTTACFKVFGVSYSVLGWISVISFLIFLIVSFYFCRKYFGVDKALIFTLLLSASPLFLGMGRRALSDSLINLLWGTVVWFFFDFLKSRKKSSYIAVLLLIPLAISVKESSVVLLVFCALFAWVYNHFYQGKLDWRYILGIFLGTFLTLGSLYLLTFGGLDNVVMALKNIYSSHFKDSLQDNLYAILFASGPWYRYIIDLMLLSPLTTLLFIGYIFYILVKRDFNWEVMYFTTYFGVVYSMLGLMPYRKLIRFVTNIDMVVCLFAVFMLYEIFKNKNSYSMNLCVFMIAMVIYFANFSSFISLFLVNALLDPTSYNLLGMRTFIPFTLQY